MASPDITTPLFEGWWCEGDEDDDGQSDAELGRLKWRKWSWSVGKAIDEDYEAVPSDNVTDDTKSSEDMTDDTKSVVSSISGLSEKAMAPWRVKANEFIASVHMERFTMVCVWLFFVQTVIQLVAAELELEIGMVLNCSFNAVYSTLYASFLGIYAVMKRRPNKFYMIGVGLYFLGYMTFTFIYASLLAIGDYHIALYHLGSWLFVIGSFLLVKATFSKKERRQTFERRFSPFRTDASCFWGSICFLVGSFFFAASAAGMYDGVSVGLSVFVAGRFYFVWGSQNKRCNFLMLHEATTNTAIEYLRSASGTLMRSASGSLEMVRSKSGTLTSPGTNKLEMMRSISKHLCPNSLSNGADGTGSSRWSPHRFLPGSLFRSK